MYKKILAAVDGTVHGTDVLDTVVPLAKLTGAAVRVVHIRPLQVFGAPFAPTSGVVAAEEGAEAQGVVDDALARLRAEGVSAEGEVDDALPEELAAVLVDRARELGSDLIVVGPGHYSGIAALLHASVSRGVAKAAPASVLLVHHDGE